MSHKPQPVIEHHSGCTADYPEKPAGEPAKSRTWIPLGGGHGTWVCDDCGASVMVPRETTDEVKHGS